MIVDCVQRTLNVSVQFPSGINCGGQCCLRRLIMVFVFSRLSFKSGGLFGSDDKRPRESKKPIYFLPGGDFQGYCSAT